MHTLAVWSCVAECLGEGTPAQLLGWNTSAVAAPAPSADEVRLICWACLIAVIIEHHSILKDYMYNKTTLANGLRVLSVPMPHLRSVSIGFFIAVGSRYEPAPISGASHFVEHMLFKGTERRPSAQEIAAAIEGIGGAFNAATGHELTTYWAKTATPHFPIAFDVLTDMLRCARFDHAEIEKERTVIIEEIKSTFDNPDELVHQLSDDLMWHDHPLGRDVAGTKESVATIRREQLLDYLSDHYAPANTVIAAAGQIEHTQLVETVERTLGDWRTHANDGAFEPAPPLQSEKRCLLHSKEVEQAHLVLTVPGLHRNHPDRYALRLLNAVLGQGMSSRLFNEIREKRGLAYSVYSFADSMSDAGDVGIYAGVDPHKTVEALRASLAEWKRLQDEVVPVDELTKAKEHIKGRTLLRMEDSYANASWVGTQEALRDEVLTVDEIVAQIDAVTSEQVQSLAQQLFREALLNLVVVGPQQNEADLRTALTL